MKPGCVKEKRSKNRRRPYPSYPYPSGPVGKTPKKRDKRTKVNYQRIRSNPTRDYPAPQIQDHILPFNKSRLSASKSASDEIEPTSTSPTSLLLYHSHVSGGVNPTMAQRQPAKDGAREGLG